MDSSASATIATPTPKLPVPGPGLLTLRPAFMEVGARHGITADVQFRRGRCVWIVVRTHGAEVMGMQVGSTLATGAKGQYRAPLPAILTAIRSLQPADQVPVYSCSEPLTTPLANAGIGVSPLFPPAAATAAIETAVPAHIESLLTTLVIATDASKGSCTSWRGHGWVLDFGLDSVPILGLRASQHGSILQAELHSIRLSLVSARARFAGTLDGRSTVTVLSDSQTAVKLLATPYAMPSSLSAGCKAEVSAIRAMTPNSRVTYEWVKGHGTNELNNTADRLAVLARRAKEAELTHEQTNVLLAGIQESVSGLTNQQSLELAA